MTNADLVRNMTDEEIRDCLKGSCDYCIYRHEKCFHNDSMACSNGILSWLRSEVKE
jgi:hypothetical protein